MTNRFIVRVTSVVMAAALLSMGTGCQYDTSGTEEGRLYVAADVPQEFADAVDGAEVSAIVLEVFKVDRLPAEGLGLHGYVLHRPGADSVDLVGPYNANQLGSDEAIVWSVPVCDGSYILSSVWSGRRSIVEFAAALDESC